MNYVSVAVLRYAASVLEAFGREGMRAPCDWQPDPGTPPCGTPAEYLVPDGTRLSAGGDIEHGPRWRCRKHLEHELGTPPQPQPIFDRIENPGDPE